MVPECPFEGFTRAGGGDDWGRRGIPTWWLPHGAAAPTPIESSGFPDERAGNPVLVGRPTSASTACGAEQSPVIRHDLVTGEQFTISCRDELGDSWFSITSAGGGRTALTEGFDIANISAAIRVVILDDAGVELDLPGNPYGRCPEFEPLDGSCEVHGLLSPDGRLLATWFRPDHVVTVGWDDAPPEWREVHAAWLARLDQVVATIRVLELDTGRELFAIQTPARTRLADFDGRYLVVAPRRSGDSGWWEDVRDADWTVLDSAGVDEPLIVEGPVAVVP